MLTGTTSFIPVFTASPFRALQLLLRCFMCLTFQLEVQETSLAYLQEPPRKLARDQSKVALAQDRSQEASDLASERRLYRRPIRRTHRSCPEYAQVSFRFPSSLHRSICSQHLGFAEKSEDWEREREWEWGPGRLTYYLERCQSSQRSNLMWEHPWRLDFHLGLFNQKQKLRKLQR